MNNDNETISKKKKETKATISEIPKESNLKISGVDLKAIKRRPSTIIAHSRMAPTVTIRPKKDNKSSIKNKTVQVDKT